MRSISRGYRGNKLHKDNHGLEGLPLKLLIVVIITVVALGIIMVWLSQIGGPKVIDDVVVDPTFVSLNGDSQGTIDNITVTVYDSNNNRLSGVIVYLDGLNASRNAKETGSNGEVVFTDVWVDLGSSEVGTLTIHAEKDGYQDAKATVRVFKS